MNSINRRWFLGSASAALVCATAAAGATRPRQALRILILGGTKFIGVHMTEIALARGHTVTLFNRGVTNVELFPQVEKLKGDRDAELDSLKGRQWDVVIDDSGYVPRHVRLSAQLLAPNVRQYLYISSISAYASFAAPNDEDSPLGSLADESTEKVTGETYGPLKVLCEKALEVAMPGRATVLRPGYVVGPNDSTDRFTYWPARAARGGEMLAPGTPRDHIQFIDARDLARFALDMLERNVIGTFNVVTPPGLYTMGELMTSCVDSAKSLAKPALAPHPVWVPAEFMAAAHVDLDKEIPIWGWAKGDDAGFAETRVARALQAGLKITPLKQTVRDTLAWQLKRPESEQSQLKAGLAPAREQELLTAWHTAQAKQPA